MNFYKYPRSIYDKGRSSDPAIVSSSVAKKVRDHLSSHGIECTWTTTLFMTSIDQFFTINIDKFSLVSWTTLVV